MIFFALLFMPRGGLANEAAPDQTKQPSVEDDSSKDGQGYSQDSDALEGFHSPASQPIQPKEDPVILKEVEDKTPQEGIGDAFSKNQGDRFQSKNTDKKVEFRPSE